MTHAFYYSSCHFRATPMCHSKRFGSFRAFSERLGNDVMARDARGELTALFVDAAWHQKDRGFPRKWRFWVIQVNLGTTKMLFHNSSSDSENSQDTGEVVCRAAVSTEYTEYRSVSGVCPLNDRWARPVARTEKGKYWDLRFPGVGLLGYNAMWTCKLVPMFQGAYYLHLHGTIFLRNVGVYLQVHTAKQNIGN
jgi:hypothetical protein